MTDCSPLQETRIGDRHESALRAVEYVSIRSRTARPTPVVALVLATRRAQ